MGDKNIGSGIDTNLLRQEQRPIPRPDFSLCRRGLFESDSGMPELLSFEDISRESKSEKNPEGVELPIFDSYEAFIKSAFFGKYYDLNSGVVRSKSIYEIVASLPQPVKRNFGPDMLPNEEWHSLLNEAKMRQFPADPLAMKLQRMLLILGYLKLSDFEDTYIGSDGEREFKHENQYSSFGVLRDKDQEAIKQFQADYKLIIDGSVGKITKPVLYRNVYEFFHSAHRDQCHEFIQARKQLVREIEGERE